MSDFFNNFKKLELPLHGVRLPSFEIELKQKRKASVSDDADNFTFLKALCENGLNEKKLKGDKKYEDRIVHELDTIRELGFVDYILLVWDVINFCKENQIPTGIGRGSAAGSVVLFLSGVTHIDPIKYNLYFERFISKIRAKKQVVDGVTYLDGSLMCDVDLDICYYNRPKVLEYLEKKFEGKTAKILTLNTLSSKLLIKECGKVISDLSETEVNNVSSLIPKSFGQVKGLKETHEEVEEFRNWVAEHKKIYAVAQKLQNLIKNKGVHPSGVLLSFETLENSCPTELSSDKNIVSSFDMNWVSLSCVKLDILGLRSVSVVNDACKDLGISLADVDVNDVIIYQSFQDLQTPHGLFQIEADTNFKVLRKVKPRNLEQLSGVLALARPGALAFADQYALYTNTDTFQSIHPFFDEVLKETGGVSLYQEQLMKMANKIGFTLDEAEILRRIVGKKKIEEVKKWKEKIEQKVIENNIPKEVGDVLWKVLEDSANYSFNKSHSISYAASAATTAYLKFKHPKQFFLSLLKMTRHEPDPISEISKIQKEMHAFNITLLPPHIVKSQMDFSIEGNGIRFGLLSIKGISDKSIEKLNNFKNEYSKKFEIFEAAGEAGLSIGILCSLIQAGAFEGFKQSRSKVVYEAQLWNLLTQKEKKHALDLAEEHDHDLVAILKVLMAKKCDKGKSLFKETRLETIRKRSESYKAIYTQNKNSESFANWYYEKSLLGYTYNKTLMDIFMDKKSDLVNISEVKNAPLGTELSFVGQLEEDGYMGISKSAKKSRYCRMSISDETSSIRVMIFNKKLDECKDLNQGMPKEKNIVIVRGTKFEDAVFADLIAIQDNKVYTKLSELKNSK